MSLNSQEINIEFYKYSVTLKEGRNGAIEEQKLRGWPENKQENSRSKSNDLKIDIKGIYCKHSYWNFKNQDPAPLYL